MSPDAIADAGVEWSPQPEAARLVDELFEECCGATSAARTLRSRMRDETGTRLIDWVDHLAAGENRQLAARLAEHGFEPHDEPLGTVWNHPQGLFPRIVLLAKNVRGLAVGVESVADFVVAQGLEESVRIEGPPGGGLRRSRVAAEGDGELWVVERHGHAGFEMPDLTSGALRAVLTHDEAFRRRRRRFDDAAEGFQHAGRLVQAAVEELGINRACDLFFAAEREYWQRRNRAAGVQKVRQDALGLGWANHDHHTYRASREHFGRLIGVLQQLGFALRERFYAGQEAGWGAQVLEQPDCGIVVFADVDLKADEVRTDFAHQPLPRGTLGTVGLWCRLHGEAFLEAGMHHLECRFDYAAAREQLRNAGVESMPPFTDFPYLKQAFTRGEMWPVAPARVDAALADELITPAQAETFRSAGALGSHLEILQRDDGYKGFNQTGVSDIIRRTDPRSQAGHPQPPIGA